ncbi:MAG: efflux RND transporter periplasmic adaptor subunit [Holophagaceae bacterium]|nr:efflux RND transporter periplasmic adaptor subunit [Holophagaceae bacterium]
MKINTLLFVSTAAILLTGGSGYWYFSRDNEEVRWRTGSIDKGDVRKRVSATGTIYAMNQVPVGTQVSGMVMSLNADFNSLVKKDQIIATIDDLLPQQQLRSAENDLENQKTSLDDAERQYLRYKELHEHKLCSDAELEQRETNYRTARTRYENGQITVEQRKLNLSYCIIRSPIDGVVINRARDVGETVQASMNVPTLFTIAEDLSTMKLEISMDEADIAEVAVGQVANFTVDSVGSDTPFYGTVAQVRIDPVTQQNVVNYKVVVEVQNRTKQEIEAEKEMERQRRQAMLAAMESGQFQGGGDRGDRGNRGSSTNNGDAAERQGGQQTRTGEARSPQQDGTQERRPGGQGGLMGLIITGTDGQPDYDATWEARKEQILERQPEITKEAWVEQMKQMAQRGGGRPGFGGGPVMRIQPQQRAEAPRGGEAPASSIIKSGGLFYQGEYVLRPGMTANVTIITREKTDVLRVPNVALRFNASQYVKEETPTGPGGSGNFGPGQSGPSGGGGGGPQMMRPGQPVNMQQQRRARVMDRGLSSFRDDRIWVLDDKGKPKSIPVVVGLIDNQFSEVSGTGLTDEMQILIGVEEGKKNKSATPASPFGGARRF